MFDVFAVLTVAHVIGISRICGVLEGLTTANRKVDQRGQLGVADLEMDDLAI